MSAPSDAVGGVAEVTPATVAEPVVVVADQPTGHQGRYAGIISRGVAVCVDAVVLAIVSIGTLFVLQAVLAMFEGVPFGDYTVDSAWGIVIVTIQATLYFTVAWAVFGRSGGEALVGLRLVRRNGEAVGWARAFVRFLVWPLVYVFCGLGFFWILIDRHRRTWADLAAGTVVIYDWRRADRIKEQLAEPHH